MYIYSLRAEYQGSIGSIPIPARNDECAKVIAAKEISAKYVSDRRLSKGHIALLDPKGNVVMEIPEEGKERKAAPPEHLGDGK